MQSKTNPAKANVRRSADELFLPEGEPDLSTIRSAIHHPHLLRFIEGLWRDPVVFDWITCSTWGRSPISVLSQAVGMVRDASSATPMELEQMKVLTVLTTLQKLVKDSERDVPSSLTGEGWSVRQAFVRSTHASLRELAHTDRRGHRVISLALIFNSNRHRMTLPPDEMELQTRLKTIALLAYIGSNVDCV